MLLMAAVWSGLWVVMAGRSPFLPCNMYPEYGFTAERVFDDENDDYSLECKVNNATLRSKVFLTLLTFAEDTSTVPSEHRFFSSCLKGLRGRKPDTVIDYAEGYTTPIIPDDITKATQCRFKFESKARALEPPALVCGFTFFYMNRGIHRDVKRCTVAI